MKLSLPLTGLLCAGMLLTSAASRRTAELTGTLKRIQHSGTMTLGYFAKSFRSVLLPAG